MAEESVGTIKVDCKVAGQVVDVSTISYSNGVGSVARAEINGIPVSFGNQADVSATELTEDKVVKYVSDMQNTIYGTTRMAADSRCRIIVEGTTGSGQMELVGLVTSAGVTNMFGKAGVRLVISHASMLMSGFVGNIYYGLQPVTDDKAKLDPSGVFPSEIASAKDLQDLFLFMFDKVFFGRPFEVSQSTIQKSDPVTFAIRQQQHATNKAIYNAYIKDKVFGYLPGIQPFDGFADNVPPDVKYNMFQALTNAVTSAENLFDMFASAITDFGVVMTCSFLDEGVKFTRLDDCMLGEVQQANVDIQDLENIMGGDSVRPPIRQVLMSIASDKLGTPGSSVQGTVMTPAPLVYRYPDQDTGPRLVVISPPSWAGAVKKYLTPTSAANVSAAKSSDRCGRSARTPGEVDNGVKKADDSAKENVAALDKAMKAWTKLQYFNMALREAQVVVVGPPDLSLRAATRYDVNGPSGVKQATAWLDSVSINVNKGDSGRGTASGAFKFTHAVSPGFTLAGL